MEVNRIFSAEQIAVPPNLPQIIKDWTKAVLREQPEDVLMFSSKYFQEKHLQITQKKQIEEEIKNIRTIFDNFYDVDGNGRMVAKEFKKFIFQDLGLNTLLKEHEIEDVILDLDVDNTGFLEINDIIQWYTNRFTTTTTYNS
jgi:Ca2+-binding EF-hand superfamily protein